MNYSPEQLRAIDALVAEHVMGLKVKEYRENGCTGKWGYYCSYRNCERKVPFYSRDIAAAWGIVEKLREDGWKFTLHCPNRIWPMAEFTRGNRETGWADAPDVLLAICLAALMAKCVDTSSLLCP